MATYQINNPGIDTSKPHWGLVPETFTATVLSDDGSTLVLSLQTGEWTSYLATATFEPVSETHVRITGLELSPMGSFLLFKGTGMAYVVSIADLNAGRIFNLPVDANDTFLGTTNGDFIDAGWGDDVVTGGSGDDTLEGGAGNDTLDGGFGADRLDGGDGDDVLKAQLSHQSVPYPDSGPGIPHLDTLIGGSGNDTYVLMYGANVVIVEEDDGGVDTVEVSSGDYILGDRLENLTGTGYRQKLTGNGGNNVIKSVDGMGGGDDTLDGGVGADTMSGGEGGDTYFVDDAGDVIIEMDPTYWQPDTVRTTLNRYTLGEFLENLTFIGSGDFVGTGNAAENTIIGGSGNDTLDGGEGYDLLIGGDGDDLYWIDNWDDTVLEEADGGLDTVEVAVGDSFGSLYLFANVENLRIIGSSDYFQGYGNSLDNRMEGGDGAESLNGGSGRDTILGGLGNDTLNGADGIDLLIGGEGDDTYVIDADDILVEEAGGGIDTVVVQAATYRLGEHFENLVIRAESPISAFGNEADNRISVDNWFTTDDTLDGGAGADTLLGGFGYDTYIVDNAGDVIQDSDGRGVIHASVSYDLGDSASMRNLVFVGAGNFKGKGSLLHDDIRAGSGNDTLHGSGGDDTLYGLEGNDLLLGGTGNDRLHGGLGADSMAGGLGNDIYYVDDVADVVVENPLDGFQGGDDTIVTTLRSYALRSHDYIENLTGGDAGFVGTGNSLDNRITGGAGADTLDGGAGRDTLMGRGGNDVYIVDDALDFVAEFTTKDDGLTRIDTGGIDTVRSRLNAYTLGDFVENLAFIGAGAFVGTGNGLANVITGGAGNDVLAGGGGNDTLIGGEGVDRAVFSGKRSDYAVQANGDGTFRVVDTVVGRDGSDVVRDIRFLQFADQTIAAINAAPANIALSNTQVLENAPTASVIATVSATDGDGDGLSFAIESTNGPVRLDGRSLVLTGPLDYETQPQFQVTIRVTDAYGASAIQSFVIDALNVIETTPFVRFGDIRSRYVEGEAGDDVLYGTASKDVIKGGAGNDKIYGKLGSDSLYGGAGKDSFYFDTKLSKTTNVDRIYDFNVADDSIVLENSIFTKVGKGSSTKPGKLSKDKFWTGTKAHDSSDRIIYDKKSGALYYDADGNGAKAQVKFATLQKNLKVSHTDFFIV